MIKKEKAFKTFRNIFFIFAIFGFIFLAFVGIRIILFNNSLSSLLENRLGLDYKVVETKYSNFGLDLSASWWIALNENSMNKEISLIQNHRVEWLDELVVEKKSVQADFNYQNSLEDYALYAFDMGLGILTICSNQKYPCIISLLKKEGESNLFVTIRKT